MATLGAPVRRRILLSGTALTPAAEIETQQTSPQSIAWGDQAALPVDPGPSESAADRLLTEAELKPIADEAIARWRASNLVADIDDRLQHVTFDIADLPGRLLGQTDGTSVSIDTNAAGCGWYIDPSPIDDLEFDAAPTADGLTASSLSPAHARIDLLTAVEHELGHVLGFDHPEPGAPWTPAVMEEALPAGVRILITPPSEPLLADTSLPVSSPVTDAVSSALTIAPTVTWIGNDGFWDVGANWSTGVAPGTTDDVLIDTAGVTRIITIRSGVNARTLLSNENIVLQSGSLTIGSEAEINGTLTLASGTLGGTGSVTITGAFDVTGSSTLGGTGTLTTQGTSTVSMAVASGVLGLTGGKTWINQGVLTIGSDERLDFGLTTGGSNTLTIAVGATLNLSSTSATPLDFFTGTATLNNAGTLHQTVAGAHAIAGSIAFNNTGTVTVDAGTLTIGAGGTDTGTYAVDAAATLNFSGGTRTLGAGTNVTGLGRLTVSGATVNANALLDIASTGAALSVSSGTLNVGPTAASGTLAPVTLSGGVLNFNTTSPLILPSLAMSGSGGTLGGTAAVTITGAFTVTGSNATPAGPGSFTTQATSTLNAPGPTSLVLVGGKTWNNQGTLTIGGDERILFGFTAGGINTLNNTGTLNLSSASSNPLSFWTGTATLNNAGTLNQTLAGAHAIDGSITVNNSGTVTVDAGTLTIAGGGTDAGTYAVDAGAWNSRALRPTTSVAPS